MLNSKFDLNLGLGHDIWTKWPAQSISDLTFLGKFKGIADFGPGKLVRIHSRELNNSDPVRQD